MSKPNDPKLWNKIKDKIKEQNGGRWNALIAAQASNQYKLKGGGWIGSKSDSSLKKWLKEKWRYEPHNNKTGRYLPDAVWRQLTPSQIKKTNYNKISNNKQYVPYESFVLKAFKTAGIKFK